MSCAEEADYSCAEDELRRRNEVERDPEEESKKARAAAAGEREVQKKAAAAAAAAGAVEEREVRKKEAAAAAGGGDEAAGRHVKIRTMCKYYEAGTCSRNPCVYAHDQKQIGQRVKDTQGLKTTLCRNWGTYGDCKNKDECQFAHGQRELGQKKPAVPPASQKKGGKGKAGSKTNNADRPPLQRKGRSHARTRSSQVTAATEIAHGSTTAVAAEELSYHHRRRARSDDSRSPQQVLLIIIQTCSLFPLHQDKTLSAK